MNSTVNQEHVNGWQRFLRTVPKRLSAVVGLAVAGGLAAFGLSLLLPNQYEAVALVKVGQAAQINEPSGGVQSRPVEDPGLTTERVKSPSFLAQTRLGDPGKQGADLVRRVFVRRVRDTDLLEIRYRGASVKAARDGLDTLVTLLRQRHDDLAAPSRRRVAEQLRLVQRMRGELVSRRAEVVKTLKANERVPGAYEYPFLHLGVLDQDKDLAQWEASLQSAAQPPMSTPTAIMEPIFAGEDPVSPNRVLLTVAGFLSGLIGGMALVLAVKLWRKVRRPA